MKPGLTGYWQAYARSNVSSYEHGERQVLELKYVSKCSIAFDIKIFFKTISSIVQGGRCNLNGKVEEFSYSFLTPYYSKVKKEHLIRCIESELWQTIPAKEIILVRDGPVPEELQLVEDYYLNKYPEIFKLVILEVNSGAGIARREGALASTADWIAPLDSDDITLSYRIELEYNKLCENPELDIISSDYCEFSSDLENIVLRDTPEKQEEILKYAKRQNPFGHSSMLIRKSKILGAGNYRHYNLVEDYDLWIRMLMKGAQCYNIQKPLVYLRAGRDYYKRRGGIKYLKGILQFLKEYREAGFFGTKDYVVAVCARTVAYLIPFSIRRFVYRKILRKTNAINTNNYHKELREMEKIDCSCFESQDDISKKFDYDIKSKNERRSLRIEAKGFSYSFLTSLYMEEKSDYLIRSIESMLRQTLPADEIVLVQDGPITSELSEVVNFYVQKYPNIFKVVKLDNNLGLGEALKLGVLECKNDWIARFDTDDVMLSNRIETQYEVLCKNPNLDIISSIYCEFSDDANNIVLRNSPEIQEEILEYARRRNPFGHSSILFNKSKVLEAGNYRHYSLVEDYDLWIRMFMKDVQCYNIQKPLVYLRAGKDYYKRRSGIKYLKSILQFLKEYRDAGFFGTKDYVVTVCARTVVYLMPFSIRRFVYMRMLRSNNASDMNDCHRELKEIEKIDCSHIRT